MSKSFKHLKEELAKANSKIEDLKKELSAFSEAYDNVCEERDKSYTLLRSKRKELSDALVRIKILEHTEQHLKSAERTLIEKDELIESLRDSIGLSERESSRRLGVIGKCHKEYDALKAERDKLKSLQPKNEVKEKIKKFAHEFNKEHSSNEINITIVRDPDVIIEVFDVFFDVLN